LPTAR